MLAVYLDASTQKTKTDPNQQAICVAGCLASVEIWNQFERDLKEVLDRNGLQSFHMTDCEAYGGEYLGWSKNRHDQFMKDVLAIINARVSYSVASAVAIETYSRCQGSNSQLNGVSAFTFCALQCLQAIAARQDELNEGDRIHYLFESGDRKGAELSQLFGQINAEPWRRDRYRVDDLTNGWSFVTKKEKHALASCDFCAYEGAKEMVNYHLPGRRLRPPRRSALEFLLRSKVDFRRHSEEGLNNLQVVKPQ